LKSIASPAAAKLAIEEVIKRRAVEHRVKGYNNLPTTPFNGIKKVREMAAEKRLPN
jgi:hypothetical protein